MTNDLGRAIDPNSGIGGGPDTSDINNAKLPGFGLGGPDPKDKPFAADSPSKSGDWVSRRVDADDDPMSEFDIGTLHHQFRDIVLVSGEGDAPTMLDKPIRNIFPGAQEGFDISGVANGGPGGIMDEKKKSAIQDFNDPDLVAQREAQEQAKKAAADEWKKKNTLQPFKENPDLYKQGVDTSKKENNNSLWQTFWNGIKSAGGGFVDPEQSHSGEGFDPHEMFDDLLGEGPLVSDKLGIDFKLVGKMLGEKAKPTSTFDENNFGKLEGGAAPDSGGGAEKTGQLAADPKLSSAADDAASSKIGRAVNVLEEFFKAFGKNGFNSGIEIPKDGMFDSQWLDALLDQFGLDAFANAIEMPQIDFDANSLFFEFGIEQDNDLFLLIGDHDSLFALADIPVEAAITDGSPYQGFANIHDNHRDWH